jgi:hypothetical protein
MLQSLKRPVPQSMSDTQDALKENVGTCQESTSSRLRLEPNRSPRSIPIPIPIRNWHWNRERHQPPRIAVSVIVPPTSVPSIVSSGVSVASKVNTTTIWVPVPIAITVPAARKAAAGRQDEDCQENQSSGFHDFNIARPQPAPLKDNDNHALQEGRSAPWI